MIQARNLLLLAITAILLAACRKDQLFTDDPGATLSFSQEEVLFDTIFTTVPFSVTKRFRVTNPSTQAVRVDIALEGGSPSPFRINVDGAPGISFADIEILGGDSIYVFVEASLDQTGQNTPLIHEDHVLFLTNGNEQRVKLIAWGQDAHFFYPDHFVQGFPDYSIIAGEDDNGDTICEIVNWPNDKPYVIYGYAVVDSCSKLTIDAGARVYVHGSGGLWIYRWGQIEANGTSQQPITFQSDRREPDYADLPGQWDRIWINDGPSGQDNLLKNVVIRNALVGIQCENFPLFPNAATSEARLVLDNVEIHNCSVAGILSRNYSIKSTDLLVGDCGQHSVALTGNGRYAFDHTTIANLWPWSMRNTPAFVMTNTYTGIDNTTQVRAITGSVFENSIIHGSNTNEFLIELNSLSLPTADDLKFNNILLRTDQSTNGIYFPNQSVIYRNQNPGFADQSGRDFRLTVNAYSRDRATAVSLNVDALEDLEGNPRFGGTTDLGCYEYTE
ncbi:MAG: hypothetical protein IPL52_00675 [Flavobacteriales bacterium]|nr:hypothetical protein [Flavobacteriales bacterium]